MIGELSLDNDYFVLGKKSQVYILWAIFLFSTFALQDIMENDKENDYAVQSKVDSIKNQKRNSQTLITYDGNFLISLSDQHEHHHEV